MNLFEAQKILNNAGYRLIKEFRDNSQKADWDDVDVDVYRDKDRDGNSGYRARIDVQGKNGSYFSNHLYKDKAGAMAKKGQVQNVNKLINAIDDVANRYDDYDIFVKRYDEDTIQIRLQDNDKTGGPFLQIGDMGDGSYECQVGKPYVSGAVQEKYWLKADSAEKVLNWVHHAIPEVLIRAWQAAMKGKSLR